MHNTGWGYSTLKERPVRITLHGLGLHPWVTGLSNRDAAS